MTLTQVNVLRATEEIGEIEKSRVKEEAKAEVLAAKKELRTLSKRMEQQCTREVRMIQPHESPPLRGLRGIFLFHRVRCRSGCV